MSKDIVNKGLTQSLRDLCVYTVSTQLLWISTQQICSIIVIFSKSSLQVCRNNAFCLEGVSLAQVTFLREAGDLKQPLLFQHETGQGRVISVYSYSFRTYASGYTRERTKKKCTIDKLPFYTNFFTNTSSPHLTPLKPFLEHCPETTALKPSRRFNFPRRQTQPRPSSLGHDGEKAQSTKHSNPQQFQPLNQMTEPGWIKHKSHFKGKIQGEGERYRKRNLSSLPIKFTAIHMDTCILSEKCSSGIKYLEHLVCTEQIYRVSLFNLPPLPHFYLFSTSVRILEYFIFQQLNIHSTH